MIFQTQMFHVGLLHETMKKNELGKDMKNSMPCASCTFQYQILV